MAFRPTRLAAIAAALLCPLAHALPALGVGVTINENNKHQVIEGWGTGLWSDALPTYQTAAFRNAYRDLGLNITRVYMDKNVLVASPTDYRTEVTLGNDLQANIAKMDFGKVNTYGQVAKWLAANALEPDEVRIEGAIWSPPHWMKGPTGASQQWVGNPSNDSPSRPTPWLSDEYNHWRRSGGDLTPLYSGDSIGGRLKTEDAHTVQQYGRYVAAWTKGFEQAYGVKLHTISLQNESTFENPFDSMNYIVNQHGQQDFTEYAKGLKAVKDAWTQFGLNTNVMGPHVAHFNQDPANPFGLWWQLEMIKGVKNHADPDLIKFLDYYNANFYNGTGEGTVKNVAAYYHGKQNVPGNWASWLDAPGVKNDGKGIWYSETGGEKAPWLNGSSGTTPGDGAITVALKMHNALVHSNAAAYTYWQMTDGSATETEHNLLGTNNLNDPHASKKYSSFKHFSRYIRPGARRIDAVFDTTGTSSLGGASQYDTQNAINVSAFLHDENKTATIVFVNMRSTAQTLDIDVPWSELIKNYQVFLTDSTRSWLELAQLTVDANGKVSVNVPRYSLVTLYGVGVIPEPATAALLLGAAAVVVVRRRRVSEASA